MVVSVIKNSVNGICLLLFVSSLAIASPPEEQAEDIPQVLFGCVKKLNGQLRVVDSLDECLPSESPVTFTVGQAGRRCPTGESLTGFTADGKMICSDGTLGTIEIGVDCPHNLVPGADLRNCDFSNRMLVRVDLTDADARGAIFFGANLNSANLTRANLVGAQFAGANINGTIFEDALLEGVTIGTPASPAAAYSSSFVRANLTDAQLYIYGDDINFTEALLTGASMRLGSSSRINSRNIFQGAAVDNLRVLYGTRCWDCDFSGVNGDSTSWSGEFRRVTFNGAVLPNSFVTVSTDFSYSVFDGANLAGSIIYGSFSRASLIGADLTDIRWYLWPYPYWELSGADLTDASLLGTYIYYWSYIGPGSYYAPIWNNTTCPDGSNSDDYPDGSCYWGRIN